MGRCPKPRDISSQMNLRIQVIYGHVLTIIALALSGVIGCFMAKQKNAYFRETER